MQDGVTYGDLESIVMEEQGSIGANESVLFFWFK